MALKSLELQSFRNLHAMTLPLSDGINVLWGGNGSGKTSVLEALHLLSHGRSFRSHHMDEAIGWQCDFFRLSYGDGDQMQLRLVKPRAQPPRFERNGKRVHSSSELATFLPVQTIWADTVDMIGGAPSVRRSFVDRGCFFMAPQQQTVYARYNTAMRQRNQLVRDEAPDEQLTPWELGMAEAGETIAQARNQWLDRFNSSLQEVLQRASHPWVEAVSKSLNLRLVSGWNTDITLAEGLRRARRQDARRGYSTCGPHRADLAIQFGDAAAATTVSAGQRKLLTCLLIIAQGQLLQQFIADSPLYLFDDLVSELDEEALTALCDLLQQLQCRCVITAIRTNELEPCWRTEVNTHHISQLAEAA